MPSPLETMPLGMMIQSAQAAGPTAQGDQAQMVKMAQAMQKKQLEDQAMQKFHAGLMQRLNPRIGTKDDADPQFNPVVQLMMKLRGMSGVPQ